MGDFIDDCTECFLAKDKETFLSCTLSCTYRDMHIYALLNTSDPN